MHPAKKYNPYKNFSLFEQFIYGVAAATNKDAQNAEKFTEKLILSEEYIGIIGSSMCNIICLDAD